MNPTGFGSWNCFARGPRPVNEIHLRLKLRQSQASQHLKVLKDVGLVEMEPRAQQRLYRLRAEPLKQLHDWLDRYRHIWEERFEELDEIVEELKQKEQSDAAGERRIDNAAKSETIVKRTSDRETRRHPHVQCAGAYCL